MPSRTEKTDSAALDAVLRPLRFAARDNFKFLSRIKGLEESVRRTAQLAAQTNPRLETGLNGLLALLPTTDINAVERRRALQKCLSEADRLAAEFKLDVVSYAQGEDKPPPQAPAPRSIGVKPISITALKLEGGAAPLARGVSGACATDARRDTSGNRGSKAGQLSAPDPEGTRPIQAPPLKHGILELSTPLQFLKGVGPHLATCLLQRDVQTLLDLLWFLPRRYQERHRMMAIGALQVGEVMEVEGVVVAVPNTQGHRAQRRMFEVTLADNTGALTLTWFGHKARNFTDRFHKGARLRATGMVKRYRSRLQMVHPEINVLPTEEMAVPEGADGSAGVGMEGTDDDYIVPLYAEVPGVTPKKLRDIMRQALERSAVVVDQLPPILRERHGLLGVDECLRRLHEPPPLQGSELEALRAGVSPWHQRLIYEELLLVQLAVLSRRHSVAPSLIAPASSDNRDLSTIAGELFPFHLTSAQERVLATLQADLRSGAPMNRLLQGDVGSGKTAIALTLAAALAEEGLQTAIMAPTELLAEQHAQTATKTLSIMGVRIELLTGSINAKKRLEVLAKVKSGEVQVLIGTHAIIQDRVEFQRLGLAIIDEQHRFGVVQRAKLLSMGHACTPHMLVMTATPIPRTLALTVYGDLDVVLIDELPPGRKSIRTRLFRERDREAAYAAVRKELEAGRQAYIVLPLVEGSDKDGMQDIRDATSIAEELRHGALAGFEVGLLHGRMKGREKDSLMQAFSNGALRALVATTVIEVGIDVPNASVMVVEHAERFGLSQLHQLRGRVGRGEAQSYCFMIARYTPSEDAWRRLEIMVKTNDGFRIAEEDLAIRGPGDVVGTRQSGLPILQVANLARDIEWMQRAREDAKQMLNIDPQLALAEHVGLRDRLNRAGVNLASVG